MSVDLNPEQMPFGAKILDDGRVRFRIWMPQQEKVIPAGEGTPRIYLPDDDQTLPMQSLGEGWYELVTGRAAAGSRYMVEFWNVYQDMPGWRRVPDPASLRQEREADGFSVVVDTRAVHDRAYDPDWKGIPLEESVFYEMHVGSFTPEGTLRAAREKLPYLKDLGVTMIELMPVGAVGCDHDWGYDETLKSALHNAYGTPDDMADFVREAHRHGIGVMFDVVDNHLGVDGHYLTWHTPEFWKFDDFDTLHATPLEKRQVSEGYSTPWGPAIDFSRPEVRAFFAQKNLWLQYAYGIDGLRRDAVHAIRDDLNDNDPAHPHYLVEAFRAATDLARREGRAHFTIVLENEHNQPSVLSPEGQDGARGHAQWADDFHHAVRSLMFIDMPHLGFIDKGYYKPYTEAPADVLAQILARGYALDLDTARNESQTEADCTAPLDPRRSVFFTANHDQIGNTPQGNRIEELLKDDPLRDTKLRFAASLHLLSPMLPMIFMGQERADETRFPFFATWTNDLGPALNKSRRDEFPDFDDFDDAADVETFRKSQMQWKGDDAANDMLAHYRSLIRQRKDDIVPHLSSGLEGVYVDRFGPAGIAAEWVFGDGASYRLTLNPGDQPVKLPYAIGQGDNGSVFTHKAYDGDQVLPPWSISYERLASSVMKQAAGMAPRPL